MIGMNDNNVLQVRDLCKQYPSFLLDHVSFTLEKGRITGFIGRNGAGKTTTLKSLLNFVHPDTGDISVFGMNFCENELEIKHKIGFVAGGFSYYPRKKLKTIADVTKSFYSTWDERVYREYLHLFGLDENKTPSQLSDGMKVKFALLLALSHGAELLILDEPTSGLDPVSREELMEIFLDLKRMGTTILFSTHITSDLDKCADNIIYIKSGKIVKSASLSEFTDYYKKKLCVSGYAGSVNLEQIMLYIERGEGRS